MLITGLGLILAGRVTAQTFTTLYSFTGSEDGGRPEARLLLSGNTLYGTARLGGSSGAGTVFAVNTDGTGFTTLYSFTEGSDGANPKAGLILSGNTLYGTAVQGGDSGNGTVFAVNTNGTGFTTLHSFTAFAPCLGCDTNSDGANPYAGLILSGEKLYGMALEGGRFGNGTVFAVNTNGTGFTTLHSFTEHAPNTDTNSDGSSPNGGLILAGNTLYGTAQYGGSGNQGTVFAVNTDGTAFKNLHSFAARDRHTGTNSDGAVPVAGLILSGSTLYGTAYLSGSWDLGTMFRVNTDGTGFTNLHSFVDGSGTFPNVINTDGTDPNAGLVLSGNTLYGTARFGGSWANGTVFALNTDGTGFMNVHSFEADSDGANLYAGLILSRSTLYGTASYGGSSGAGTVFSLSLALPPQLTVISSGANIILTWPANASGFTLQSAPVITSTFTNIPGATSPYTNAITSAQQFFQLISN